MIGKSLPGRISDALQARHSPKAAAEAEDSNEAAVEAGDDSGDAAEDAALPQDDIVKIRGLEADFKRLEELLRDRPWEMMITKDAWREWAGMDAGYR